MPSPNRALIMFAFVVAQTGCAITYYDRDTSTMHVFGLSHMKMRVPPQAGQTVYHQVNDYGLSVGTSREGGHLAFGYYRETTLDVLQDQTVCFEWPDSDLLNVKVGREFPVNPTQGCASNETTSTH